jgi:hypothetical protein
MEPPISYQYYHSHAILVINPQGAIRVVHTPFRVTAILPEENIPQNTLVFVSEVLTNPQDELLYVINGRIYPYWCFRIKIKF